MPSYYTAWFTNNHSLSYSLLSFSSLTFQSTKVFYLIISFPWCSPFPSKLLRQCFFSIFCVKIFCMFCHKHFSMPSFKLYTCLYKFMFHCVESCRNTVVSFLPFIKLLSLRKLIAYSLPDSEDSSSSRRTNFLSKHTKTLALPSLNIYCKLSTFIIQCYIAIKYTILLFSQKLIKTTQLLLSSALACTRSTQLHEELYFQIIYLHIYIFNIFQAHIGLEHTNSWFCICKHAACQCLPSCLHSQVITSATLKTILGILFFIMIHIWLY